MCCSNPNLSSEQNSAKGLANAMIVFGVFTLLGFAIPPYLGAIGGLFAIIGGSLIACCGSKGTTDGKGVHIGAVVMSALAMVLHLAGVAAWLAFWFGLTSGITNAAQAFNNGGVNVGGVSASTSGGETYASAGGVSASTSGDTATVTVGGTTYTAGDVGRRLNFNFDSDVDVNSDFDSNFDSSMDNPFSSSSSSSFFSSSSSSSYNAALANNIAGNVAMGVTGILIWPSIVLAFIAAVLEFAMLIVGGKAICKISSDMAKGSQLAPDGVVVKAGAVVAAEDSKI